VRDTVVALISWRRKSKAMARCAVMRDRPPAVEPRRRIRLAAAKAALGRICDHEGSGRQSVRAVLVLIRKA